MSTPVGHGESGSARARKRARLPAALAGLVALVGVGSLVLGETRRSLPPLDLAEARRNSTVVVDRDGRLLRPFTMDDGRWRLPVRAGEVDQRYLAILKAFEDRRFDSHGGVDPVAVLRAAGQFALNGRIVSGASTLTMQVARLAEPRTERSFGAKLRQALRALDLEARHSKSEILDLYLALAPYGGNIEGLRAASWAYFAKEPARLSAAEAALLVALPQSPETRRPDRHPEAARRARDRVLDRAREAGILSVREVEQAKSEPVPDARRPFPMLAAHAAEAAVAARPDQSVHRLAVDARLQASLEALVRERIGPMGDRLSAAVLVVDAATGEVRAHVGGVDYLDPVRSGSLDLAGALRSPGSALKPFIYALAFESGLAHPETVLDDRPSRFGAWSPENFDLTFQGTVTARRALQQSLNVPAVDLLSAVGPTRFLARLKAGGATIVVPEEATPGLAVGLGGLGTRLVDLARLYTAIARGGEAVPLSWAPVEEPASLPRLAVFDRVAAWYVADVLRGAPPPVNAAGGRIAYKTGTSYGYRDAWAIGFDRKTVIAVWVGRADGAAVPGLVGRTVAAPLLFEAFARRGGPIEPVPKPPNALVATTAELPPPLRHMRPDQPKTVAATFEQPLRIAFPPDGARVDLGLTARAAEPVALALKATGGTAPLTFLVNGLPVGVADHRRQAVWSPDGAGFADVSVIDARGETATARIRVE